MYEDDAENEDPEVESPAPVSPKSNQSAPEHPTSPRMTRRERRSSMPLSVIGFMKAPYLGSERQRIEPSNQVSAKELALKLQKTAQSLFNFKSDAVAQEITRQDLEGFLKVEVCLLIREYYSSLTSMHLASGMAPVYLLL